MRILSFSFVLAAALCGQVVSVQAAPPVAAAAPLSKVFRRVDPAVVVVRTSERKPDPQVPGAVATRVAGIGSGVLVAAEGKVVTAAHVVQTADQVTVEFGEGTRVQARVVASDAAADLALLQLERVPSGVVPARLGDSDRAEVGDQVFVVGAPLGITHTLTVGHVSARRRPNNTFGGLVSAELLQTDAAINQGNSGGPMFNLDGEVIGIVSHIVSRSGGSEGLGFVVTSNMARHLLFEEPTAWSGLEGYLVGGELAQALNLPAPGVGLLVQRVAAGSPAERLGVRGGTLRATIGDDELLLGGDVILSVEGIALSEPGAYEGIRRRLVQLPATASPRVALLRSGRRMELGGAGAAR